MKLKLLPKLLIGFGSLGLMGVVIGLVGILSVSSVASAGRVLNDDIVLGLGASTELISSFQQIQSVVDAARQSSEETIRFVGPVAPRGPFL